MSFQTTLSANLSDIPKTSAMLWHFLQARNQSPEATTVSFMRGLFPRVDLMDCFSTAAMDCPSGLTESSNKAPLIRCHFWNPLVLQTVWACSSHDFLGVLKFSPLWCTVLLWSNRSSSLLSSAGMKSRKFIVNRSDGLIERTETIDKTSKRCQPSTMEAFWSVRR